MKFIVTNYWMCEWRCSDLYDLGKDGDGNVNNVLVVEPVTNVDDGDNVVESISNIHDSDSTYESTNEENINKEVKETPIKVVKSDEKTEQKREAFEKKNSSNFILKYS